jgi:hypothetical protein
MATTSVRIPDTLTFEFEGRTFSADGGLEFEFTWADFGIGSFEAWGQRGFDSQMGADDLHIIGVEIEELFDAEGDSLPKAEEDALANNPKVAEALLKAADALFENDTKFADQVEEIANDSGEVF